MNRKQYEDWHQEISQKVADFLVQEIGKLEAADMASRRFLSKAIIGAFWSESKRLVSHLAPKVLDNVLDRVSDISLNDLMAVLGYTKERRNEQKSSACDDCPS